MFSRIGILHEDGTTETISCSGGYRPERIMPLLTEYYGTVNKIKALLALGDISSLGKRVSPDPDKPFRFDGRQAGVTVAYYRDCNYFGLDAMRPAITHESIDFLIRLGRPEYAYLFDEKTGRWMQPIVTGYTRKCKKTTLSDLIEMLTKDGTIVDGKSLVAIYPANTDENDNIFDGCLEDARNAHIFTMYGSQNVKSWEKLPNSIRIVIEGERIRDDQKFYFTVYDGKAKGQVALTFAQALAVARALDRRNWVARNDQPPFNDNICYGAYIYLKSTRPAED